MSFHDCDTDRDYEAGRSWDVGPILRVCEMGLCSNLSNQEGRDLA